MWDQHVKLSSKYELKGIKGWFCSLCCPFFPLPSLYWNYNRERVEWREGRGKFYTCIPQLQPWEASMSAFILTRGERCSWAVLVCLWRLTADISWLRSNFAPVLCWMRILLVWVRQHLLHLLASVYCHFQFIYLFFSLQIRCHLTGLAHHVFLNSDFWFHKICNMPLW